MTNLKKIGLTALAGTLAATTFAQAGDLSVSGTARMEYQSTTTTTNAGAFDGKDGDASTDTFAQNHTLTFSGSGEMDNGHTVSYMQALASGALTSANVKVDMGDMGTVSMASHSAAGISTIQDMVPNGGEQPWDDLGTAVHGRPQDGIAQPHAGNRIGYTTSAGGATFTAAANYEFGAPTSSIAVQLPNLVEGLNIGGGLATDQESETVENDIETMFITYTMGSVSVGAQTTDIDHQTASSDIERTSYGISFAVNDNFSIGYGVSDVEYQALTKDEESKGFGAAYTVGSMKIGFINNKKDNLNGGTSDMEMNELQLTFAF
jgi:outer membrane protein OmpU